MVRWYEISICVHCNSKSNHASLHSRLHRPVDSQQHIASHRCSPIRFIWTSRWKQYGFAGAIWCTTCTSKQIKTTKKCQTKQKHLLMNIECTGHSKTSGTKTHCWWAVQVEMVEQGHSLDRTHTASFSPGAQLFMHPDTSNVPCWWSGALSHVSARWGSWGAHTDVVLLSSTSKKTKRRLRGVIQFSLLNLLCIFIYIYIHILYIHIYIYITGWIWWGQFIQSILAPPRCLKSKVCARKVWHRLVEAQIKQSHPSWADKETSFWESKLRFEMVLLR